MSDEIDAAVDRVVFGFRDRDFAGLRLSIRRELEAVEQRGDVSLAALAHVADEKNTERALADALGEALERTGCMIPGASCLWRAENQRPFNRGMCPRCAALAQWKAARDG